MTANRLKEPAASPRALSHIRVIDLAQDIAGSYCTKLAAGFGAEVLKVEPPETGDRMRGVGPFCHDHEGLESSIPFLWLNTGKKSITLDLQTDEGIETLKKLIEHADVLVESFSPGVMASLGLGYDALSATNPRLVMASISNFGQTGPYRHYEAEEIETYAMSGGMYVSGDPDKAPLTCGPAVTQYSAGLHAYTAILMSLFHRASTGHGQYVDVSAMECGLENIENRLTNHLHTGKVARRGPHTFAPWGLYRCRDGYAAVVCAPFRRWTQGAEVFEEPRLLDEKLRHVRGRVEHRDEVNACVEPWLANHTKKAVFEAGIQHDLAFGFLADFDEVLKSPQHSARGFFVEIEHPTVGTHKYCGAPFKMSRTPWQSARAPLLGEHDHTVQALSETSQTAVGSGNVRRGSPDPAVLSTERSPGKQNPQPSRETCGRRPCGVRDPRTTSTDAPPLDGVRVLDLTHAWSGPHCTRMLADFGAEVIRVEYAKRLCLFRAGQKKSEVYNNQPVWFQLNRNKFSVTLDLKKEKDQEIFNDMVRQADVVVENSRGGVMERLGLAYDDLIEINPNLILLSMAAYGKTGPYAAYPAYGAVLEVMSGIQNLTGYSQDDRPYRFPEMDVINGIGGAAAVVTALLYRQQTGRGQHIDLSQMELPTHALIGEHLLEYAINNTHVQPMGNRHRRFAPQGCYRCRGEDKWVTLTVRSDREWERFCEALDRPEWKTDERFSSAVARRANHDELDRLIEEWTATRPHYEAMHILQSQRIPSGAVLDVADLAGDEHLRSRGYFTNNVDGSDKLFMGLPFRMSRGGGKIRWRGPDLGEHNSQVLRERLGRSEDEIEPVTEEKIGTAYDSD